MSHTAKTGEFSTILPKKQEDRTNLRRFPEVGEREVWRKKEFFGSGDMIFNNVHNRVEHHQEAPLGMLQHRWGLRPPILLPRA